MQAAVLASRLAKFILDESRIQFESVKFLTDSTTLARIQRASRSFKPFVSSRVGEIQSKSDPSQWKHIPSEENVADDLSRGLRVQQLTKRWINGPRFLTLPEEQWPVQTVMPSPAELNMECRHVNAVSAASQVDIGNRSESFYQLAETDTRKGMAGEISRKDTLSKKPTWRTRRTSHMHVQYSLSEKSRINDLSTRKMHLIRGNRRAAVLTNRTICTLLESLLRPVSIRVLHVIVAVCRLFLSTRKMHLIK